MILLATSAAFVGLIHSLAPGHWLPVVLLAKTRKWGIRTAMLGAIAAASGHILVSNGLGFLSVLVGWTFLPEYEHDVERYSGIILIGFGLIYAGLSYFRHSGCHGHTHHGPNPDSKTAPLLFLFSLGFIPCVAVVPIIATAATKGTAAILIAMGSFSIGVLTALIGATAATTLGLMKLDHPIFEHYGDVLTGMGVALMGVIVLFFPH
ncbi:MAG: hypothetical protein A2X94_02600 [Bdellovibrionales bacterium GWB1_55_8]|nr:MAG: hypothetical protein A2X94_02600 [Bdellovibrionales bacterium GWB1_55_8]